MHDSDIRPILHSKLREDYPEDDTLILDEMALCQGKGRVDIAVLNGSLLGFEIKSERDSLDRLPRQVEYYGRVFHKVSLYTNDNHIDDAKRVIPKWWGLYRVRGNGAPSGFDQVRKPQSNPDQDAAAIAQFLWRWELLEELEKLGIDWGVRSKTRWEMCQRLAEHLPAQDTWHIVRRRIKGRTAWRSDPR